jgi:hypothetical protein
MPPIRPELFDVQQLTKVLVEPSTVDRLTTQVTRRMTRQRQLRQRHDPEDLCGKRGPVQKVRFID